MQRIFRGGVMLQQILSRRRDYPSPKFARHFRTSRKGTACKRLLYPPDKVEGMCRAIRATLHRAHLTYQETQTLRGMIVALTKGKHRARKTP